MAVKKRRRGRPNRNQNIVERKRDDGSVMYRINRDAKSGVYKINADSWQRKWIAEIELRGFDGLPSGLYTDGRGMTAAGSRLLESLSEKYANRLRVCVAGDRESSVKKNRKSVLVTLNYDRLRSVNAAYRGIRYERNREMGAAVDGFLQSEFPTEFVGEAKPFTSYVPGSLARLLETPDVLEHMSPKDQKALQELYPKFLKGMDFSLRSTTDIRFAKEGVNAATTVYLEQVVAEYERKLKRSGSEHIWQQFLRKHILLFLHSYAAVIEKQSVDIDGKFPDFMLVDPYGYLDIYEIKKPQTTLLKHDSSRNNYYWAPEICKAMSQVEHYIDQTRHYRLEIAEKVRTKQGLPIKIVRPRGFIIAGTRSQLDNDEMAEDFRVLNDSLKNIDVLFYDDLLENIKAMLNRFSKGGASSAPRRRERAG